MAKTFVKISLASKFRVLFGVSVLGVIAAALLVPWYFVEMLVEEGVQQSGAELTRLRLNEWYQKHPQRQSGESDIAGFYTYTIGAGSTESRHGPAFIRLASAKGEEPPLDAPLRKARKAFDRNPALDLSVQKSEDSRGQAVYRILRAVRMDSACIDCHQKSGDPRLRFQPGQLVALIDVSIPSSTATGSMIWWTRGAFVVGGGLAVLVALFLFTIISHRLVLRPVRHLKDVADKVTEGDLSVRSTIRTGDELQRLGDSFNEMLAAIADQHSKLRSANRALDLKLSELAEANVALFHANSVKNEFLANVSHELRTPLNSIIGFADLVADTGDERLKRYGQNINSAAKRLLSMINDLLDLAKIEAGKADVRFDKVSVTDACQTLASLMKPLADKKDLALQMELSGEIPLIQTDASKLQQILYNLLSNAIKFTPAGGQVTLSTGLSDSQRGDKPVREVSIAVADTGPGIAETEQQHIFEKFYTADRTLTREASGTGLGLAISKELTSLLNGRLTVKSSPGHGAVFTLFLPLEAAPDSPTPAV